MNKSNYFITTKLRTPITEKAKLIKNIDNFCLKVLYDRMLKLCLVEYHGNSLINEKHKYIITFVSSMCIFWYASRLYAEQKKNRPIGYVSSILTS